MVNIYMVLYVMGPYVTGTGDRKWMVWRRSRGVS
jgi:hypothetical protein